MTHWLLHFTMTEILGAPVHLRRFTAASAAFLSAAALTCVAVTSASATTPTTLYVDSASPSCTNSGTGTQAAPFCSIQTAADVVQPGQTVLIGGGFIGYVEDVTVKTSGTATAPITFAAADTYFRVAGKTNAFTLAGVSNIVIRGLQATSVQDTVAISGSSNITIDGSRLRQGSSGTAQDFAGVHVTSASSAVTIERSRFDNAAAGNVPSTGSDGTGVRVDGGSTGTVVATNYFESFGHTGVAVAGASGTDVVGNTLVSPGAEVCGPGISVTSGSTATVVENNVVTGMSPASTGIPGCSSGSAVDLLVSADSATTTTEQYNILSPDTATTPYEWAGTSYTAVDAFQTATGKGAQDIIGMEPQDLSTASFPTSLPLIDSADANAPGETSTDIYGNPRVDDPSVPNSGTGPGYYDRGAIEYQEYTSSTMTLSLQSPQMVDVAIDLKGIPWGVVSETIDWGDGTKTPITGTSTDTSVDFTTWHSASHMYASRGMHTITETLVDAAGTKTLTGTISTTGSTYTPVTPTRILDTRHGTGTGGATTPVAAGASIAFDVTTGVPGAPAVGSITAVVLNVTVTAPTSGAYITAYPDGTSRPSSSNLNFHAGETVPNLVTVEVGADGKIDLYNGSAGTTHLVADVEGYYTATSSGSGFVPVSPTRLLDTRKGTGTNGSTNPVPASGTLNLKVEGSGPIPASGVTAVVLNVTVTAPTGGGYITVYPGGSGRPTASNLNFSARETVPNLVIVPVGPNGTVTLYNGSGGTVHLIADASGYYTKAGGDAFVPIDPIRVLDTRTGRGQDSAPHPVAANGGQFVDLGGGDIIFGSALVLNVTVTGPTAGGYLTVYPGGTLPAISNLNFSAGETVPNLVITAFRGSLGPIFHNGSGGTVNLVADAFGYFG